MSSRQITIIFELHSIVSDAFNFAQSNLLHSLNWILSFFIVSLPAKFRELVKILHAREVDVYLVSGGFDTLIEPVAKELGIPVKNIFANRIKFFYDGKFTKRV